MTDPVSAQLTPAPVPPVCGDAARIPTVLGNGTSGSSRQPVTPNSSLTYRIVRGSVVLTVGEIATHSCSLLRNVILARLLTRADFGTAALLGMTVSIFEIGGRLSIEQCVVQSKDGGEPRFIAGAHLVQCILGLLSAVLILVTARPMAAFFEVPDAAWALRVLALLPVLRSLSHLDVYRVNRDLKFGRGVVVDVVPQVLITIAAWPLAHIWPTYAVLVWLLIAKQMVSTLASHAVALSPYRWFLDFGTVRAILTFGWPVLINGFLTLAIMQGDRFAVGLRFTVSELAVYTIAGSVVLLPAYTLRKLSGYMMLPLLASVQDDAVEFRRRVCHAAQVYGLLSASFAIVLIVAGGSLVVLAFGEKYRDAGPLIVWLALAQALHLLQCVTSVSAAAQGDTKNMMLAAIFRLAGLALAFTAAYGGASLVVIAACATVGEAVALLASVCYLSSRHDISVGVYSRPMALAVLFLGLSAVLALLGTSDLRGWILLGAVMSLLMLLFAANLALFPESRRFLHSKFAARIASLTMWASPDVTSRS